MSEQGFSPREERALQTASEERYERMKGARAYRNADFVLYICAVVLFALAIRAFICEPIRVEGDSMVPTLIDTEHMFVEKVSYWFHEPARGEIVICYYPGYTKSCVKRVIGLPGDTVAVTNGLVTINGSPLREESYWQGVIYGDMEPVTVGEKELFVMGDNRNGSKDSRSPSVGCIPYTKIVGKVRAVIWPVGNARGIPQETY